MRNEIRKKTGGGGREERTRDTRNPRYHGGENAEVTISEWTMFQGNFYIATLSTIAAIELESVERNSTFRDTTGLVRGLPPSWAGCYRLFYGLSWVLWPNPVFLDSIGPALPLVKFISHTGCGGDLPTRSRPTRDCREICSVLSGSRPRLMFHLAHGEVSPPSSCDPLWRRRLFDELPGNSYRTRGAITTN